MAGAALGLIETIGLAPAAAALDAALDTANVQFVGKEKVIGAGKSISVTVQIVGEVAAVEAAVYAGKDAAEKVGKVLAVHVIPRPHDEVQKMLESFKKKKTVKKQSAVIKKEQDKKEANK